jgi:DNA-binding CsgD family transcriptional regulator
LVIRIGAIFANGFILAILLKNLKRRTLAVWFLVATIPGILAYGIPRFASFILEDVWITLPQLYLISMIWQVLIICLGLFKVNSIHYAQLLKPQELDAPAVEVSIQNESIPAVLSSREHEILLAFANGFSYTEISDAFLISPHTVRTHIRNIYSKLEINSKAEAVRWVMEQGRD